MLPDSELYDPSLLPSSFKTVMLRSRMAYDAEDRRIMQLSSKM